MKIRSIITLVVFVLAAFLPVFASDTSAGTVTDADGNVYPTVNFFGNNDQFGYDGTVPSEPTNDTTVMLSIRCVRD